MYEGMIDYIETGPDLKSSNYFNLYGEIQLTEAIMTGMMC